VDFLVQNLEQYPEDVGEIMVMPWDSAEDIEKQLVHSRIRGLKCYHIYADRDKTFDAYIGEYLPESAWEVANKHKMPITLHMVRDQAQADPGNLEYIKTMAKKYPDTVLILAHVARAFAAWTAFGTVDELVPFENVWFDFSGVCESPAMTWTLKKVGAKRCMWGSDYTVSMNAGKCIALGDAFYWIGEKDLPNFSSITTLHNWHAGTENLMAVRQATEILELPRGDIEDLFYNTAASLFDR
jgi:glutamate-1-semialdehyde 2,1-aminomutase